jgi:hypothetical protein
MVLAILCQLLLRLLPLVLAVTLDVLRHIADPHALLLTTAQVLPHALLALELALELELPLLLAFLLFLTQRPYRLLALV